MAHEFSYSHYSAKHPQDFVYIIKASKIAILSYSYFVMVTKTYVPARQLGRVDRVPEVQVTWELPDKVYPPAQETV